MQRLRRHWRTVVFDLAPVIILLVIGLGDVVFEFSTPYAGYAPWWTPIGPVVIACCALLIRRRAPMLCLAIVLVDLVLPGLLVPVRLTYWGEYVVWLVAMYSAGRHAPWRRGVWAIPLTFAAYAIAVVRYPLMREPGTVLFNMAILIGLWVLGRFATSWTEYRDRTLLMDFERKQAEERAEARERARIARELHDVISHTITVIVLQAGGARLRAATDPGAALDALGRIETLGRESLTELRTLLTVLREDDPDATGTAPQPTLADLSALCDRMRGLGLPVQLRIGGAIGRLGPGVQLTGYRIVQESLTNVLKHAGAVATEVTVDRGPTSLVVEVSSAGGTASHDLPSGSRGLDGLRERVEALGGTLRTRGRDDGGFVITAGLPVPETVA